MRKDKKAYNKYYSVPNITAELALEAIHAALQIAQREGIRISIAVVDTSLALVAFVRADHATPHSAETSRRKANTAASTGKTTGWMPPELSISLPLGTGNLLTNIPGGVPIRFQGTLVGGLGVAGGTVEQDALVATRVLGAIEADLP